MGENKMTKGAKALGRSGETGVWVSRGHARTRVAGVEATGSGAVRLSNAGRGLTPETVTVEAGTEAPLKRGLPASHPGELLRDVILPDLKKKGIPKVRVAADLGISRRTLEDLVLGKQGVSPEMALRLAKYLRGRAAFWLDLQRNWDLEQAEKRIRDQLAAITPLSKETISS